MDDFTIIESFPMWKAILWCFYPMTLLVSIELFLRALSDDDDDDDNGKGIRIEQGQMQAVPVPSA
tara:strand:- start:1714 stop:1908 length:195 start_codon:yes stop_codon:yes gene_type:complete